MVLGDIRADFGVPAVSPLSQTEGFCGHRWDRLASECGARPVLLWRGAAIALLGFVW
jgi:hypothetical protein